MAVAIILVLIVIGFYALSFQDRIKLDEATRYKPYNMQPKLNRGSSNDCRK